MKTFWRVVATFILISVFSCLLMWSNRAKLLANILSNKLKVPVSIEALNFTNHQIVIHNLSIDNPVNATTPFALKAEKITFATPYFHYLKDPIIINEVLLNKLHINIEFYTKNQEQGNWITLVDNTNIESKSIFSIRRSVLIHKLKLTNIDINLQLAGEKIKKLTPIPELTFENVSSERGIPTHEITEIIIQNLMNQVFIIKGFKAVIEAPKHIIEGLFAPFRWFDKKSKAKEEGSPAN